jgi:hypothetical protein
LSSHGKIVNVVWYTGNMPRIARYQPAKYAKSQRVLIHRVNLVAVIGVD